MRINFKELLVYVFTGFYIGFFISAFVAVSDICGGEGSIKVWGPLGFLIIATVLLMIYYFVSKLIKKDLLFILIIVVFAVAFEGLIAQPLIKRNIMDLLVLLIAMPIVHLAIFYLPRVIVKKIFKK